MRNRQLLTCASAAPFHGLWSLPSSGALHVHHRRAEAVTGNGIHHAGLLLPPQPDRPVAALADVLIHALRCLRFAESLVMVGRNDRGLSAGPAARKAERPCA
ncbi:hypothetical protein [Pseudarthrobacter cellobiosi]|uniref:hypothetical protein n=1 Tax=Pseudarthrobacter cellobiosi TaxID=2953654 RepID=UPI00208E3C1B|nr:hypothetical protein [Pseudarthrobacter sp. HLT1-5]MCO4256175.1 hypothetical protein [Pseudarthrobacter sp. HLT1-5]